MNKRKKKNESDAKAKRPFISKMLFVILAVILVYLYARYVETSGIYVREYNIKNENIPESFDGFSIVQFSDLELGSTFDLDSMQTLVKKINDLKPDIVVFTGDIVSKYYKLSSDEEEKLISYFDKIDPLIDKYAIRGDDDITGLFDKIIEKTDFIDLNNKHEFIYFKGITPISIYGLDSLINDKQDIEKTFSSDVNDEVFKLLLAHEPDTIDLVSKYNIDLMLSGHSHNNEVNIPYLTSLYRIEGALKYSDEKYVINGTELYISSGLGTSKLKLRLFSKPSISIFRLYRN